MPIVRLWQLGVTLVASALLATLLTPGLLSAQPGSRADLTRALDSIIEREMAARQWPSVAVFLMKGRDTILSKAYGRADLELDVPARADGIYWIGSVTKQFVAAEILRLAERGIVSLDDSVGRWVPSLPDWWRGIGLRELLWHTSGIASYTGQPRSGPALIRANNPVDSTLAIVRDLPPDFPRGSNMLYNNTGYILLGRVIEGATRKPLAAALRDDLFTPLGLSTMSYCDLQTVTPKRVTGYQRTGRTVRRAILWWPDMAHGAGALCGTVGDLVAWSRALHGGRVLSTDSYRQMTTPGQLADGTPLRYGMGVLTSEVAGRRAVHHSGGIAGFTTWLAYLPDDSVHLAMTVNLIAGSERPSLAGIKVIERVLGPVPTPNTSTPPAVRDAIRGRYRGAVRTVTVTGDSVGVRLMSPDAASQRLSYRGARDGVEQFVADDGTLVLFDRDTRSRTVTRVRLDAGSTHLVLLRETASSAPGR